MKGYVSILRGAKFKNKSKLKSLFLPQKLKEEKANESLEENGKKIRNISHIKRLTKRELSESKKMIKLLKRKSKMTKILEDYEDLFFYLLKHSKKIELFEVTSNKNSINSKYTNKINSDTYESESEDDFNREKNNIDIHSIFYKNLYIELTEGKKQLWEGYYFPKAIFKILYKKSKIKQKEIFDFIQKYGINYEKVINSYEKIYTIKTQKKNWDLEPIFAYNNYMEIYHKDNMVKEKEIEIEKKDDYAQYMIKINKDIVIKTNNKGNGKTLIFDGKLLDVYVDDYLRKNKEDHIISIYSPHQKKKEIIYNAKDLLPKIKQSFSFEKNNFFAKGKYNPILTQKSNKNIISNLIKNGNVPIKDSILNKSKNKSKNKRNSKYFNDNENKKIDKLNMNKLTFSNELPNPFNFHEDHKSFSPTGNSSNLILRKILHHNQTNKKEKKNILFNMIKFSYY